MIETLMIYKSSTCLSVILEITASKKSEVQLFDINASWKISCSKVPYTRGADLSLVAFTRSCRTALRMQVKLSATTVADIN